MVADGIDYTRVDRKLRTFIRFARELAGLSACRRDKVGCVVFPKDFSRVVAIGYNGPPRGCDNGSCSGEEGLCGCAHAETNAMVSGLVGEGLVLFSTRSPCIHCGCAIANCQAVTAVIYDQPYKNDFGVGVLLRAGKPCVKTEDVTHDTLERLFVHGGAAERAPEPGAEPEAVPRP